MHVFAHVKKWKSITVGHKLELQAVVEEGDFLFAARAPFQGQSLLEANCCPLHPAATAAGKNNPLIQSVCRRLATVTCLSESHRCELHDSVSWAEPTLRVQPVIQWTYRKTIFRSMKCVYEWSSSAGGQEQLPVQPVRLQRRLLDTIHCTAEILLFILHAFSIFSHLSYL